VLTQLFGCPASEHLLTQHRSRGEPGRGRPHLGKVVEPPQFDRGFALSRFGDGRAIRKKQPRAQHQV
jgi:hypothetical protein